MERSHPPEAPSVPGHERLPPVPWPLVLDASLVSTGKRVGEVERPCGGMVRAFVGAKTSGVKVR